MFVAILAAWGGSMPPKLDPSVEPQDPETVPESCNAVTLSSASCPILNAS